MFSGACGSCKLALLEALPAEHRPPLSRTERHGRFLPAGRTVCCCFHPLSGSRGAGCWAGCAFGLAALTALWFVFEILVGEEKLLARRPNELRSAIHARERLILELHRSYLSPTRARPSRVRRGRDGNGPPAPSLHRPGPERTEYQPSSLVRFASLLLPRPLARQGLLGSPAIAWLQVERMLLDIFDDIFLLHFPLEATKRAFDRLAFLNLHFSQTVLHLLHSRPTYDGSEQPLPRLVSPLCPL